MSNQPPLIYVAGPYRANSKGEICNNISRARFVSEVLWRKGYHVFTPHLNTAHFDGVCRDENFLDFGLRMVKVCDAICMVPWWQNSTGSIKELDLARRLKKTIYMDVDTVPALPDSVIDREIQRDLLSNYP